MKTKEYQVVNGTSYHVETSAEVIRILEIVKSNNTRIVLDYGDVKTGKSWGEVYDITGRVGRSCGSIQIPLLIHNKRSSGGGAILDHCIIGIKTSIGKVSLYELKIN